MKTRRTGICVMLPLAMLAACASHDYRDIDLLGDATDQNIALHSVRDVDKSNYGGRDEGGQGETGAQAVSALRTRAGTQGS